MGCGCGRPISGLSDLMQRIWGRPQFDPGFPRTDPTKVHREASAELGMAPMGVSLDFDMMSARGERRPLWHIEEKAQHEEYPFPDMPPTWYAPVPSNAHNLNDRFAGGMAHGFVRPYSAGIKRGESQALWGVQRRKAQLVIPLPQQSRAGAVDARTALAYKHGPALDMPRWFTGAIDEDKLVERARRKIEALRGR
jgi:hypothetical protein